VTNPVGMVLYYPERGDATGVLVVRKDCTTDTEMYLPERELNPFECDDDRD